MKNGETVMRRELFVWFVIVVRHTSSFYRAFREWEGVTPAQWREQNTE